ncbi:MAG: polysaccharide lyase [Bacteroidota bacterium]|nr:polysaccharide lyase [Bacteroidota bacterium]
MKKFILSALSVSLLFACEKKEIEELSVQATKTSDVIIRDNLLLDGTFETGDLKQFDVLEAAPHELVVKPNYRRRGTKACRVELNSNEPNVGGSRFRAELVQYGAGGPNKEQERWFGFSMRVPEDWRVIENTKSLDIFFQIHDRPDECESYRTPPLSMFISKNMFQANILSDSNPCTKGVTPKGSGTTSKTVLNTPLIKGSWVDWVIHVKWSYKNDGLLEIWHNGKKVTTYRGPIGYNDKNSMYLKMGLYHIGNGDSWPDGLKRRVLYLDEIRMGGPKANYSDVKI